MNKKYIAALALFSGGLDSILSCRVILSQSIRVKALRFVTPFFGYDLLRDEQKYIHKTKEKYGIDVALKDISVPYLEMLKAPAHGYGKNFNPCLDCKILLMTEARKLMDEFGSSFIISGEVVGQRPMSQRRDTLRVVERDSGCEGLLVRPLCAKNLSPTKAEEQGLVDRDKLLNFSGRGRKAQMRLAEEFGIKDYPTPAGGCLLTDQNISKRIEDYYQNNQVIDIDDIRFLLTGRQFKLPNGGMLAIGRSEGENRIVHSLAKDGDRIIKMKDWPGPTAVLRYGDDPDDQLVAAGLAVRYGKKRSPDMPNPVVNITYGGETAEMQTGRLEDDVFRNWII